ncbi:hypothetical protein WJX75_004448 [Coccomyxa subellipsoidea]|uniref:Uncharacterized protein n=1 Tax=Coccomyxa subellipsoidea TaxID=248742 RepID=A0ABR2YGB1_9CHLO
MKSSLPAALSLLFLCWPTFSNAAATSGYGASTPSTGSQCQSGCCNLGRTVFEGACSSFANYFKNDADTALSEGDAAFAARVANAPVPSSRCCIDARSYTQYSCACNSDLMNAASGRGVSNNAVRVVGRATRFSVCTSSSNGGAIQGGC